VDRLSSSSKIKKNPAGLPLLETTYVFNGHQVGTARHYQKTLFSDLLF